MSEVHWLAIVDALDLTSEQADVVRSLVTRETTKAFAAGRADPDDGNAGVRLCERGFWHHPAATCPAVLIARVTQ